ncbi:MAG: trigger factor [Anaerolineales bacterium]
MKFETQPTENHEILLTIEVEAEEFERAKRQAARKIAQKVKIPGFRPGKAPYDVIARNVGEAAILEDAIEALADELYPKALKEADITPGAPGALNAIKEMNPLRMEFLVPLEPTVELNDYREIRLPYDAPVISDDEVKNFIEVFRHRQAVITTVQRPAQAGDVVHITLTATSGDEALVTDRHTSVVIPAEDEEGDLPNWPFSDFHKHVIGMSEGETKDVQHTYPEDSEEEIFRGKEVTFHFEVSKVTERELPELDDEFAQSMGAFETFDDFQAEVRQLMEENTRTEYDNEYQDKVLDALIEQAEVKYPPAMLQNAIEEAKESFMERLDEQGLTLETYAQIANTTVEEIENELREAAEKRLKRTLVLDAFIRAEKITANEDDVQQRAVQILDGLSENVSEKDMKKILKNQRSIETVVSEAFMNVVTRNAMLRLSALAQGKADEPQADSETAEDASGDEVTATEAAEETPEAEEAPAQEAAQDE